MKLVHIKNFTGEHLRFRQFLCYLPTELVIPCPRTGKTEYDLDRVFAYRLPRKDFPPKYEEGTFGSGNSYKTWHHQIAIEWHTDCGDDGHVNYKTQDYYMVLYENEIDLNNMTFLKYNELTGQAFLLNDERLERERLQLTFNHMTSGSYYNWLWT